MTGLCKDCRFWVGFQGADEDYMGMRECTLPFADEAPRGPHMAALWDGALCVGTTPDFGCIRFEQKETTSNDG
jgi:hypothetical protein